MKKLINNLLAPFNIEIHGKGYLKALSKGEYDIDEFKYQKEYFSAKEVQCIFDLGANNGDIAQRYLDLFPEATIHCFEPVKSCFAILKGRFKDNPRVILNNIAISDKQGVLNFYVNSNVDTSSLLQAKEIGLNCDKNLILDKIEQTETISLDDYCLSNQIEMVDILKMDIQGGEFSALIGSENILSNQKINLIYFETYFQQQYVDQPLFYKIGQKLFEHGYILQDLYSKIYGNDNLVWCDAIFLPKK